MTLIDHDLVELTNLQRQIAHTTARLGINKAISAAQAVHELNPEVQVAAVAQRANAALLRDMLPGVDVVLDCTDNFATRQAINQSCVALQTPLVSGSAVGVDAQIGVFDTRVPSAPCYACVFPPDAAVQDTACATMGVLAPLVGVVGCLQATQAIELLVTGQASLTSRLVMLGAWPAKWDQIQLQRDPNCPVCAHRIA